MKCVVTGGEGFIGRHVVRALRGAGHEVVVLDVAGEGVRVDICDRDALLGVFKDVSPEAVFHLAAVADARDALGNPTKTVQINIGGTASVLDAARQTKVKRVILASTCWVANAMGSGLLDETSPFLNEGGGHVYTTTKVASEHLTHDFQKLYGLPFTILRYGIPYGPGMWPGLVLKNFLDQAFAGKPLRIFGDGSASRRFVFVEDLARAHVLALQDIATNQVYNLEGMRFVTVKELANLVSKMLGGVTVEFVEEPNRVGSFQYFRKLISSNKAYIDLGWAPEVELEDGVRRTIDWYRQETGKPAPAAAAGR
jgi:UDP-glucose 4-epimerase